MKEKITLKGLKKRFNKELGYNLNSNAFNCILDSLDEYVLSEILTLDDIDIYPAYGAFGGIAKDRIVVRYYGLYHLCNLYNGIHYFED